MNSMSSEYENLVSKIQYFCDKTANRNAYLEDIVLEKNTKEFEHRLDELSRVIDLMEELFGEILYLDL